MPRARTMQVHSRHQYRDESKSFLPEAGWMVWACIALGTFDASVWIWIVKTVFFHH